MVILDKALRRIIADFPDTVLIPSRQVISIGSAKRITGNQQSR
jgi:hypothetical protein